jgi:hypothetical protein
MVCLYQNQQVSFNILKLQLEFLSQSSVKPRRNVSERQKLQLND